MLTEMITILPWIIVTVTIIFFLPAVLHYLWNITMPELFGLKKLTYWQAFRLFLISFVLFGVWFFVG